MLFVKLVIESFLFAFHALIVNKLRTILSLLGITIGIFAIISVFTIVDSLEYNMRDSVQSLGDNVIYIEKWPWDFDSDYPWWKYMNRPLTSYQEMQEVKKRVKSALAVSYMIAANGVVVKFKNSSAENTSIVCASHEYDKIKSFELSEGRYFSMAESEQGRNFCIIGITVAESLFGVRDPIGNVIDIRGSKYSVIGVFKKEGDSFVGNSSDNVVLIPINTARKIINVRKDRFHPMIMVKGLPNVSNDDLKAELRGIMRSVRRLHPKEEDSFAMNESKIVSMQLDGLFKMMGMAGWIIGGFAILVGGFGIANIMFVSVKERTNIIGIQKSLGAKNYFILLQFLAESVALCLIGGAMGLLLIYGGTVLVNSLFDLDIFLSFSNILLAFTVSAIIGIIAGFVPAYSASRMDPVEAIRTK